jgi:alkaline phosphatase
MASASASVTDSAAASSSWGGGHRVNNGSLNTSPEGKEHRPIFQKLKKAGKRVGCITTVPVTHATPAGFCIAAAKRSEQAAFAEMYLDLDFDLFMGGGDKYFNPEKRKDKKDIIQAFKAKNYQHLTKASDLANINPQQKILGLFADDALPYSIDATPETPTLAQMLGAALQHLAASPQGFALQVEAGKVDWAAHGNDAAGLLFDQLAFDDAVGVALDFARKDKNTLVIITSDHGNANPGLIYGKNSDANFAKLQRFKMSNDQLLNQITPEFDEKKVQDLLAENCADFKCSSEQAQKILSFYKNAEKADGLYNYKNLPYQYLAEILKPHISLGWISMDHSSDFTELAVYGPGMPIPSAFLKNTQMHNLLLKAMGVDDLA